MGRGDKKTKKGKRFKGSYGITRSKKNDTPKIIKKEEKKIEKKVKEEKKTVKNKKKATTKK